MFEIHPSNWPLAIDPNDPRDEFHRTAVAEAVVATDRRPYLRDAVPTYPGIVTRLRTALAGGPARTEPCTCPA